MNPRNHTLRTTIVVLAMVAGSSTLLALPAPQAGATKPPPFPAPPSNVVATPLIAASTVSWAPVAGVPSGAVLLYRATATPGGASCTTTDSSCVIPSLLSGTKYRVAVTATATYPTPMVTTVGPTSKPSKASSVKPQPPACRVVRSGANLKSCDLAQRNLVAAKLRAGTTMAGADLSGVTLGSAGAPMGNVGQHASTSTGADLSGADLTGVTSGGIIGTPTALPANWSLIGG